MKIRISVMRLFALRVLIVFILLCAYHLSHKSIASIYSGI